jgi:CheY-like chemotaxis protein
VWIFGPSPERTAVAIDALTKAGHEAKAGETGVELAPSLRDYRPDLIVIDMQDAPERGRHLGVQLRADRATRQLPIVLVGITGEEGHKAERAVQGPTRRYALGLTAPSVLNALIVEL